ncbi:MAG: hypothetical protein Q8N36_03415, partial [bacterium]|nr:hypothetical protein [bacterium]
HLLCYFPSLVTAEAYGKILYEALPSRKNIDELFGQQYIYDPESLIVAYEEKLLLSPTVLTVEEVFKGVRSLGGCVIPAHIDRSYGMVKQLGFINEELNVKTIEVARMGLQPKETRIYRMMHNSDAHSLSDIANNRPMEIEVDEISIKGIIDSLCYK